MLNTVQNGKGDTPRKIDNIKLYNDNYESIFGKSKLNIKKEIKNDKKTISSELKRT